MSKITELARGQITIADRLTVELIVSIETPAVITIRWPDLPTITNPRRRPGLPTWSGG